MRYYIHIAELCLIATDAGEYLTHERAGSQFLAVDAATEEDAWERAANYAIENAEYGIPLIYIDSSCSSISTEPDSYRDADDYYLIDEIDDDDETPGVID
jgi:hypothetical protein